MADTPNIRFKGFDGGWEQRKLGDTLCNLQNNTLSRSELTYEEGTIKNVHYGDVLVKYGEVIDVKNEQMPNIIDNAVVEKYKSSFLQNGDVIFADTAEDKTVGKCSEIAGLTDETILSGLHTIPYRPQLKFATGYLGYYFNSSIFHQQLIPLMQGIKVTSISKSAMQNTDIIYPKSVEEQEKIGTYFVHLDHLITLHQRKCDEMKQLKKFMLQKMFPKSGELIPEIRFVGFTGGWEQRKFGTMFKRRMERNNGQFDNTRWISVAKMYFQEPGKVTSNNIDTRTYVMRRGDIAFEGHSNAEYKYGRFVANDIGDGIISELFPIYMHIDDYDEAYWKYVIQIEKIMSSKLLKCIEISYTSSNKLDEDFFLKEEMLVPSLDEQQQIGNYFRNLDHLITLHQSKCNQLKEVKRFMLQNMFPKKG